MKTKHERLVGELGRSLAALGVMIEASIFDHMLSCEDTFCAYRFELEAFTLRGLTQALQCDARLWEDFRRAIEAHRPATHWTMLLEHVYTVGNLHGKLKLLERSLTYTAPIDRRRLAEHLNSLDGEMCFCQHLADRRDLAGRINEAMDFPLIDGLMLRGITFVLGEDESLWRDFQSLVECSITRKGSPHHANDSHT